MFPRNSNINSDSESSMVPQNNPDAACMDEIKMTGEKEQSTGKPFAHHTTTPAIFLQAEQISISSFVLRTQRAVYGRRYASVSQLGLLASVVAL